MDQDQQEGDIKTASRLHSREAVAHSSVRKIYTSVFLRGAQNILGRFKYC